MTFSPSSSTSAAAASSSNNNDTLLVTTTPTSPKAKFVKDLIAAGERLRSGDLVAFPTETVYGLGCHALDEAAISKVFSAKERPLSDPLIVHVLNVTEALELWEQEDESSSLLLSTLAQHFWPGPLTLVAKARQDVVPSCITANTGFVACRSPSHAIARALIQAAGVPIAAPSANKFGHVSPTTAQHVYDDLFAEDVWIVEEEEEEKEGSSSQSRRTNVGVESTVAKLESGRLIVLRQGAVSVEDLQAVVGHQVQVISKKRATADHVAHVAPGQLIRHYSPHVPSYMVNDQCYAAMDGATDKLADTVVIDYGQQLAKWKGSCLAYRDLSPTANSTEAAQCVFETLRWAESVANAQRILFPSIQGNGALELAVQDRLTRAASGVVVSSLDEC